MTALNSLYLSQNRISDISAVAGLHKLWSLYLRGNQVSDLKPLSKLRFLSSLDLTENQVSDLSPLEPLTELRYLILNNNQISDLGKLVAMSKMDFEGEKRFAPYLRLYLAGNPLGSNAARNQTSQLEGFGVRVSLE